MIIDNQQLMIYKVSHLLSSPKIKKLITH